MSSVFTGFLSDQVAIEVVAPAIAATSAVNGTTLDMAGYEGVLWIARIGTAAANNTIKAQQGAASNLSDAADLAGTAVASGSNNVLVLDLTRPAKRYVRAVITRGTSTTLDTLISIRYKSRTAALAAAAGISQEQWNAPAEGTA